MFPPCPTLPPVTAEGQWRSAWGKSRKNTCFSRKTPDLVPIRPYDAVFPGSHAAKLDATIDITQAIVPQVERLSNKEYLAFVRRPRHLMDTDCIKLHADEATDLARKSDFGVNLRMCGPCVETI